MKTKSMMLFSIILFVLCFDVRVLAQNWLLRYLLPKDYDPRLPPIINGEVFINCSIQIHTFRIVFDAQNFRADLTLCLTWEDYRLQDLNNNEFLRRIGRDMGESFEKVQVTDVESVWYPETYFRNSVSSQIVMALQPVQYMEVWPINKTIRMCTKKRVYLLCLLDLSNFPFDQNHCYFKLQNLQRLRLRMDKIESPDGNSQVRVMHRFTGYCDPINLNSFETLGKQVGSNLLFNNQSCVYGALRFVRHINYYIIRYYTNTFLCMCIACLGPWVTIIGFPGRTIMSASVLLAIIRISHTGYDEVPARDVVSLYWWFWCCQLFVYICIMEYAVAIAWYYFVIEKNACHANKTQSADGHYFGKEGWYKMLGDRMQNFLHFVFGPTDFAASPLHRNKVDYAARIFLPSLLLIWVMIYLIATVSPWATKYRYY